MDYEEFKKTGFYELFSNSAKLQFAMYFLDPDCKGITQDSLEEDLMDLEMKGEKIQIMDRHEIKKGLKYLFDEYCIMKTYKRIGNKIAVKHYLLYEDSKNKLEEIIKGLKI